MIDFAIFDDLISDIKFTNVKPNLITGEGRMRYRGPRKYKDLKKKERRKMTKMSRRRNRG